jgi:serine/threonine protein phosphatase 1
LSELIYAIGDVHGAYGLLRSAFEKIRLHAAGRASRIVMLGDYIDRGPRVRDTIELVIEAQKRARVVCLKGNHEEMLNRCDANRLRRDFKFWMTHGGRATLSSYGSDSDRNGDIDLIPETHRAWLRSRPALYETQFHVFVHAGIIPDVSLADQADVDHLWIRDRFLKAEPHEFVEQRHIVHGHTTRWAGKPEPAIPEFLSHRTNLDTGAWETGVLSVGVFNALEGGGVVDLISVI